MDDADGYFPERVAATYDDGSEGMFDPAVIDTMAGVLAGLAGGGRALELGIGTGPVALPLARARRRGARHRPVPGHGGPAAGQAGRRRDRRHHRRLRHHPGGRHVLPGLPGLQHDREPDHAGRAGGLLPQRRGAPGAGRLLRRRGRGPRAAPAAARADRGAVAGDPDALGVRHLRHGHPGDELELRHGHRRPRRVPLDPVPVRVAGRARPDGAAGRDAAARPVGGLERASRSPARAASTSRSGRRPRTAAPSPSSACASPGRPASLPARRAAGWSRPSPRRRRRRPWAGPGRSGRTGPACRCPCCAPTPW